KHRNCIFQTGRLFQVELAVELLRAGKNGYTAVVVNEVDWTVALHCTSENLQSDRRKYRIDWPSVNKRNREGVSPWPSEEDRRVLLGNALKHQRCAPLLKGLADRTAEG